MATRLTRHNAVLLTLAMFVLTGGGVWNGARAGGTGAQSGGTPAWTQARVSPGLHSLNQSATVVHQPATGVVPPRSIITAVHVDRGYAGDAEVHTSLCWNGIDRCVDVTRQSLNTHAFNGLDAGRPMHLVHRVTAWRGTRPPLYIKSNVSVWYAPASSGGQDTAHGVRKP